MPGFEFRPWEDVEAELRGRRLDDETIARVRTGYDEARLQQRSGKLRGNIEAGPKPAAVPSAAPAAPAPDAEPPDAPGPVRRFAGALGQNLAQGVRGLEETTAPLGRAASRGYRHAAGAALAEAMAKRGVPKGVAKGVAGAPGSVAEYAGKRPIETALLAATAGEEAPVAEGASALRRLAVPLAKRVGKLALFGGVAEPAEKETKVVAGERPPMSPEELAATAAGGAKGYGAGELLYGTPLRALSAALGGVAKLGRRRGPSVDALEAKPAIGTGGGSTPAEETPPTHLQQEPAAHTTRAVNEPAPIGRGAGSTPPVEPPLDQVGNAGGVGETAPPTASGASPATSSQPPGQASGRHPTTTPAPAARPDTSRPAAPAPAPRAEPPARPGPVGTFVAERQIRETAARQEQARQAFAAATAPPDRLALPAPTPPREAPALPPHPQDIKARAWAANTRATRQANRLGQFEMVPESDPRVIAAREALRNRAAEPGQDTPTAQQQTARSAAQEALRAATGESEATSAQAPRRRRPPGPKAASPVAGAERGEEVPEATVPETPAKGKVPTESERSFPHAAALPGDEPRYAGIPRDRALPDFEATQRRLQARIDRLDAERKSAAVRGGGKTRAEKAYQRALDDYEGGYDEWASTFGPEDAQTVRDGLEGVEPPPDSAEHAGGDTSFDPADFAPEPSVAEPPPRPTLTDPSPHPVIEQLRQQFLATREKQMRYVTESRKWYETQAEKDRLQKRLREAERLHGAEPMDLIVPLVKGPKKFRQGKSTTLGGGFGALGEFGAKLTDLSGLKKAWTRFKRKLPMEREVLRQRPDSPVISEVERWTSAYSDVMQDRVDEAWHAGVRSTDPELLKDAETEAVRYYKAHGATPAAEAAARTAFPPEVQRAMALRDQLFDTANRWREFFGLDPVRKTAGPYLPRSVQEGRQAVRLGPELGGGGSALRTGPGGHTGERVFDTYREGEAAGMEYADPRNEILLRDADDLAIIKTGELFQRLEQKRVLFRDRADAAKASPTGKPWLVEHAPGGEWWTPTEAEARFLQQNLSRAERGPLTSFQGFLSAAFRNPNLVNPFPHLTKNMGAKLLLARGPTTPLVLARDAVEWARGSNRTLLGEFEEAMPFSKSGRTAGEIIGAELHHGPVGDAIGQVARVGRLLNTPSQKAIFRWGDPAMRYSLFKHYRAQGMQPFEAANHAWIDLVRYGTRSNLIDFWKSMPANFFVPWRFGTFASLLKQVAYHPVRTALLLGAVDYLREINRRKRGKWFHLPWDYVEAPIAQLAQSRDGVDLLKNATQQAVLTAAFGPGGAFGASQLDSLLKTVELKGTDEDKLRLKNMFWGISQIFNLPDEYKKGDYGSMLGTALLGEHDALQYPPRQLWAQYLPESLPGMTKSDTVAAAEDVQAGKAAQAADREALRPVRLARKEALKQIEQAYVTGEARNDPEALERAIEAAANADAPVTSDDIRRLLASPATQRARAQAELEAATDPAARARLRAEIRDWTDDIRGGAIRRIPKGARGAASRALDAAQGAR